MPMKIFRGLTGTLFPVWHLMLEGEEVAIVTLKPTAPEVRILFTENGNSRIERSIGIAVARLTDELQLIYRRPKQSLIIASLSVALGSLGLLLWRLRTKNR
jgi:hypothetical protein